MKRIFTGLSTLRNSWYRRKFVTPRK